MRFRGLGVSLVFAWVVLFCAELACGEDIRVRYRSADTVYLTAGRLLGLEVGDRLEIRRENEVVAIVEVVFVAESSASARPVEERAEILANDLAVPTRELRPPDPRAKPVSREPAQSRASEPSKEGRLSAAPQGGASPRARRQRSTRISGVASVDLEAFADDDEDRRDYDLTTARLSLRGRSLGGLPLDLRVRLRSRQIDRARSLSGGVTEMEDRDRLYELSLRWRPESDRYEVTAGRLGAGPFSGIGFLDGISGRWSVVPSWQVGAFLGQRPDIADLGFESAGTKLGVFSRWVPAARGNTEVFVAAVQEENEAGSTRQLAILETRLGSTGGRWALLQRAELDLGTSSGSREEDGQLTQLAVALSARLGERNRFVLSYDRYDPRLFFEDEIDAPEEQFRDLLRQGLRASLHLVSDGGLDFSLSGGLREGEADGDSTVSFGIGLRRSRPQGLTWSTDFLGFSNPFTEGALASARLRYGFAGGHSVGLVVGSTAYEPISGDQRVSGWARIETWFELPASLFARGDFEILAGDDAEGQRWRLGLGYRF